jgi:hypothetical protein
MKEHFNYNILGKTIVQFLDIFNDLHVARYDKDGKILKYLSIPLKFAPKTKQWYWKERREKGNVDDKIFPTMAVILNDVQYSPDRKTNKNFRIKSGEKEKSMYRLFSPVPYDFDFEVKVAAQYMADITQIVEQILPYFDPNVVIRISFDEIGIDGINIEPLELLVTYEGSSKEFPVDLGEEDYRVLEWTFNFKVQGFLFKPMEEVGTIRKVINKVYTSEEPWEKFSLNTDTEGISGKGHQSSEILVKATHDHKYDENMRILYEYEIF